MRQVENTISRLKIGGQNGWCSNDRYECAIYEFIDKNSRDNNNGGKLPKKKTGMSNTRVIENIALELNQCLTWELVYSSE